MGLSGRFPFTPCDPVPGDPSLDPRGDKSSLPGVIDLRDGLTPPVMEPSTLIGDIFLPPKPEPSALLVGVLLLPSPILPRILPVCPGDTTGEGKTGETADPLLTPNAEEKEEGRTGGVEERRGPPSDVSPDGGKESLGLGGFAARPSLGLGAGLDRFSGPLARRALFVGGVLVGGASSGPIWSRVRPLLARSSCACLFTR